MKVAILHAKRDLRIEEVEDPKAGDDGIVVKVRAAGICGSDLHPYKLGPGGQPDTIAKGHENAGEVVEVGANVKDIKVGDNVWVEAALPCYECAYCKQGGYRENYFGCRNAQIGGIRGLHGGYAEYIWVPLVILPQPGTNVVPSVIKLPETMNCQDGALIEPMVVGTSIGTQTEPTPDDVAVVLGAGMIGLTAVVRYKAARVSKIIASDVSEKRLQAAKDLGADVLVNPAKDNIVTRVMEETSGAGADIVVDAAGKPDTYQQSIFMVRPGGKVHPVAIYEESFEFNPNMQVLKGMRMITGVITDFARSFEFMKTGVLKAEQVVSHVFPLDRINEAFETAIDAKESVKVMIDPWLSA